MPLSSLLYTAELDLAEPDIKPFLDWYAYRHAPDLVPLGFESSACYGTTGGDMNLFDIYEIPNRDLFFGAGYRRMNERDKYAAPILEKRRNKAHTIYRQHHVEGLSPDADDTSRCRLDHGQPVRQQHRGGRHRADPERAGRSMAQGERYWRPIGQPDHRSSGLHDDPAALHGAGEWQRSARGWHGSHRKPDA